MRDKIITAGLTFVVIWMLARACIEIPRASVVPTPSVESIYQSQVITADNITSLVELTQLSAAGSGPVAAMTFTPDMQVLLAAYAHEGVLRHWRIQDGVLLKSFDTYPVELGATAFDGTGSLLATSAGWAWELHKPDVDYIGARVWDTQTGLLILRHIQENISQGRLYGISIMIDVVLSPDGKWLLASDASADDEVTYFKHLFQMEVATGRLGTALFDFSRQRRKTISM